MSKELVIGSNRHETKVAILEEDQLVEVYFQRGNEYSLAGSIHKGRVTRVLPGMQSAFVDLGLERDTFLYVSDFFEENEDIDTVEERPSTGEPAQGRDREGRDRSRADRDRVQARGGRQPMPERTSERRDTPVVAEPQFVEPLLIDEEPIGENPAEEPTAPGLDEERPVRLEGSASSTGIENRAGERSDNRDRDRGRNRRSRRRRPRTQGFPENKYAQSPTTPVASAGVEPAITSEFEEEDPQDVIILPGESLAKYRRSTAPSPIPSQTGPLASAPEPPYESVSGAERAFDSERPSRTESFPEEHPVEALEEAALRTADEERAEQEAIAEEAESLEFTDKVFSHRDDESVEEVEEQLEEVKHDQPAPSALEQSEYPKENYPEVTDASVGAQRIVEPFTLHEFHPAGESKAAGPEPVLAEISFPAAEGSEAEGVEEATREPLPELPRGELIESDEFDVLEIEGEEPSGLVGEELAERNESEPHLAAGTSSESGHAEGAPQTASVREQGGRYMHRSSRRMRRRRGGSRFGQAPEGAPGATTVTTGVTSPAAGAGAAMALQPEAAGREVTEQRTAERPERAMPSISDLLKAGQEIIVQIAKEPLGQKGARITSHVALPGRYVVFMPGVSHVGVSRKIASDEERLRLKRILQAHRVGTTGGFIVRTAGEGVPEEEIAADMNFLYTLWLDIRQKAEKKPAPALLHYDLDIVQRILRDQVTDEFKAIWVDNEEMYESVLTFIQRFQPALVGRVKMYTRSAPIFDAFNITQELEKALRPKVWLKSGGYIVINQTEALVAIDINTGKYVGKSNRLEDTIVKTNTEAVKEIVRQIRLRDLGGIIVVDFIDMDERKNRQKVMQTLEEAMRADKAPYKILQFNDFGLVAITRKRVKQSLERTLCAPCPYCEGAGYVKSVQTVIGEILIEAQKISRAIEGKDVMLRAHPEVAKVLKASNNRYLEELEEVLGRPVLVTADATLHQEKFDLA